MGKRGGRKPHPDSQIAKRAEAWTLYGEYHNYEEVARRIQKSPHFVKETVRRKREENRFSDRPRSGRPKKVTRRITRKIMKYLYNQKGASLRKTRAKLIQDGTPLSLDTISRVAHRNKIRRYKPMTKPKLTREQQTARLNWARTHVDDPIDRVFSYTFGDEKRFVICDGDTARWLRPTDPRPVRRKSKDVLFRCPHRFTHTIPEAIVFGCDMVCLDPFSL